LETRRLPEQAPPFPDMLLRARSNVHDACRPFLDDMHAAYIKMASNVLQETEFCAGQQRHEAPLSEFSATCKFSCVTSQRRHYCGKGALNLSDARSRLLLRALGSYTRPNDRAVVTHGWFAKRWAQLPSTAVDCRRLRERYHRKPRPSRRRRTDTLRK
jgi:hypothetical protein